MSNEQIRELQLLAGILRTTPVAVASAGENIDNTLAMIEWFEGLIDQRIIELRDSNLFEEPSYRKPPTATALNLRK